MDHTNPLKLLVEPPLYKTSLLRETYREVEDSLGIVLLHIVTFQRDVLYPAALGVQQVCSWRQGVHVGSSGGSDRWWHAAMFNTYRRRTLKDQWSCGELKSV